MRYNKDMPRKGFTLIEILVSLSLMVLLFGIYVMVANPAGQLISSRNTERKLQLQTFMNSIQQNIADQGNAQFGCATGPLPTSSAVMASGGATGTYDIAPCLVPTYAPNLPFDPSASSSYYNGPTDYNTGYRISINASGTLITLTAPYAEGGKTVTVSGW